MQRRIPIRRGNSCFCTGISLHSKRSDSINVRCTIGIAILNFALPILYCALVWSYASAFFSDAALAKRAKSVLLAITILVHFSYLLLRTIAFSHPPVTTIFEILTVLAFAVAVAYALIERRSKAKETGTFILSISFVFQLLSTVFIRDLSEVPEILRSSLFGLHITSALVGYASITISAVYGALYLMLYHEIKGNRFGVIYKKLPTLETLERMNFIAISLAFSFLTLAILAGFVWGQQVFSNFSVADPKLLGTVILWLLYGVGLVARLRGILRGRTIMVLSIVAFFLALFSMSVINLFFSGFHRFD